MEEKDQPDAKEPTITSEKPLQSWKEIAAYLEIGERTARRWEKNAGLPIRRHGTGARSGVFAYSSELDAWRLEREPKSSRTRKWHWSAATAIGVISVTLGSWFIFYGPVFNPPNPLVEAAEGITLRQIWTEAGTDDMGDVSLDGRLLTFTDWKTGDLAVRDLGTEVNRRVTDKGTWTESAEFAAFSVISPSSDRIACSWYIEDGVYEVRLFDTNRSEPQVLYRTTGGEWAKPIDWLPDESQILVGFFKDFLLVRLALLSVDDQSVSPIASSLWESREVTVSLSPDGKLIVYDDEPKGDAGQRDIFMIPVKGGRPIAVVHHPADDFRPIWTADGRSLLFASDRGGSTGLWIVPMREGRATDEPRLVKGEIGPLQSFMGCTRKGDLYFSLNAGTEDIYFFEIDPGSGEVVSPPSKLAGRFVGANMGPVFSPDGHHVAYHFQTAPQIINPGALTLVLRSLETGKEKEIRTRLIQYGPVRWFPDGESVLVPALRSQRERVVDFYRIDLETARTELIRQSGPKKFTTYHPDLSSDGQTILFMETESDWPDPKTPPVVQFKTFDIKSGHESVIHKLPSGKVAISVQFSPDEKSIAWVERNQEPPYMALNTRPVEGGTTREILRVEDPEGLASAYGFVWAPDGKSLLVSKFTGDGRRSELVRVAISGGEPTRLGVTMERILFGDVHADGGLIAFYAGQQRGRAREIWAMEGFLPKSEDLK